MAIAVPHVTGAYGNLVVAGESRYVYKWGQLLHLWVTTAVCLNPVWASITEYGKLGRWGWRQGLPKGVGAGQQPRW